MGSRALLEEGGKRETFRENDIRKNPLSFKQGKGGVIWSIGQKRIETEGLKVKTYSEEREEQTAKR